MFYALEDPSIYFFDSCRSYRCDFCGPRKAREVALAMSWSVKKAGRGRFVTLTLAPHDLNKRLQKMKDLTRWAKAHGYRYEMAWTTEAGSKTGMVHVHALQWGDYVPQGALQDRWGARVDIRAVKHSERAVGQYMAKGAGAVGQYMAKGAATGWLDWRDLNGGRPLRWSRGFFHGLGVREAVKEAKAQGRDHAELTWIRCDPIKHMALLGEVA